MNTWNSESASLLRRCEVRGNFSHKFFKFFKSSSKCIYKLLFFSLNFLDYEGSFFFEMRINIFKFWNNLFCYRGQKSLFFPKLETFTNSTAKKTSQDISLINIWRGNSVWDDHHTRSHMVGDDTHRFLCFRSVFLTKSFFYHFDNVGKYISIIHSFYSIERWGNSFQPHPRINTLSCESRKCSICIFIVLHKHIVPDFHPFFWFFFYVTSLRRKLSFSNPVKYLCVRATWSRLTCRSPPVILFWEETNSIFRNSLCFPKLYWLIITRSIFVSFKYSNRKHLRVDSHPLNKKFITPSNGFFFKIISKWPVSQHLKKRQMSIVSHIIDISSSDTLLVVRKTLPKWVLLSHQIDNEWVHSGGRKKNRWIVFRNYWSRWDDSMFFFFKEIYIFLTYFLARNLHNLGFRF